MSARWGVAVAGLLALFAGGCARDASTLPPGPTARLQVKGVELEAELAADPARREQGLMFRRELHEGRGMLFVYPEDQPLGFWMRNTYLPLSVAFLDGDGRILNVEDMEPFDDLTIHRSARPCRMALEVPRGWFEGHGIGPGDRVELQLPRDLWVH